MHGGLIVLVILIAIYFAPTVVAIQKRHHNALGVFALNLLLGWTLLGWAGALAWALMSADEPMAAR